jgi:RHS repeat-associated protein
VLVLPKGGGSIKGIGETFRADPQSGTYQVNIPIEVPAGRNGMTPDLTLKYSSGSGNGPFGLGWALTLPCITRSTRRGAPSYDDRDVFLLDGQDLIPVQSNGTETRFRMSGTEAYVDIVRTTADGADRWSLTRPDGRRIEFGEALRGIVVEHTGQHEQIFAWFPSLSQDPMGNRIRYAYRRDDGSDLKDFPEEHGHSYNQLYLSCIEYVDLPVAIENQRFLYRVDFDYGEYDEAGDRRGDWTFREFDAFSVYRPRFEIRTARRCERILVRMATDKGPEPVSTYELSYDQALTNGVSLLRRVTRVGLVHVADGSLARQDLPPLEFEYSVFHPPTKQAEAVHHLTGVDLPAGGLQATINEIADGDGIGLAGIVRTDPTNGNQYWSNQGDGRFAAPRSYPGPGRLSLADAWFVDVTGDGYSDLLILGTNARYYPAVPGVGWETTPYRYATKTRPEFTLKDRDTRLVDLDGDGVIDAIQSASDAFILHYNGRGNGWKSQRVDHAANRARLPDIDVRFGDAERPARLNDVSGDGPIDVVRISEEGIEFWPHLGNGVFRQALKLRIPPMRGGARDPPDPRHPFGPDFDQTRVMLADVDGDGYSDLLYVGDDRVTIWINQSGNRLAEPISISLPKAARAGLATRLGALRVVDLLGAGTAGLLWSSDKPSDDAGADYFFLDISAGGKPYLLRNVDNHRGAKAEVEYAPSWKYALDDDRLGRPWRTRLPFPVHVVAKVVVQDVFSESSISSEYRYHEGAWDAVEREFRGFARVDQYDTTMQPHDRTQRERPAWSPAVETRTWFHVGPVGGEEEWSELAFYEEKEQDHDEGNSLDFWTGDPPLVVRPSGSADMLASLPRETRRRVLRSLAGKEIRVEEYVGSQSNHEHRPYSVTEYAYGVREVLDGRNLRDDEWRHNPVVFTWEHGRRRSQWEQGDDPLTRASFQLACDAKGRPRLMVDVGVPRGRNPRCEAALAEPYLATATEVAFADHVDGHDALDRISCRVRYELHNDGSQSLAQLLSGVEQGHVARSVLAAECTYYDSDEVPFVGMPLGCRSSRGLPVRVEQLVHTRGTLSRAVDQDREPPWLAVAATLPAEPVLDEPRKYFVGEYFSDAQPGQGTAAFWRPDCTIDFEWGPSAPDPVLLPGNYSVRWRGSVLSDGSSSNIALHGRGFARLWVNDELLIDAWSAPLGGDVSAEINGLPGEPFAIRVEYRPDTYDLEMGGASIALLWATRGTTKCVQPETSGLPRTSIQWPDEYPAEFREPLDSEHGYVYRPVPGQIAPAGYYRAVSQSRYDVEDSSKGFGLIVARRDAIGTETVITYDSYHLLPAKLRTGGRLEIQADHEYRSQQVTLLKDANGNETRYSYTPLGLLASIAVMGRPGDEEGDEITQPSVVYDYGLTTFDNNDQPLRIRATRRIEPRSETLRRERARRAEAGMPPPREEDVFPENELKMFPGRFLEQVEYSDGFGRLLQARSRHDGLIVKDLGLSADVASEPGPIVFSPTDTAETPAVRVHGWVTYDNKGRVVEQYEPFFDTGWKYQPPDAERRARKLHKVTTYRDPRGLPVRIIGPDGSEQTIVHGRPTLNDPEQYRPSAWEFWEYDANDNAGRTHAVQSQEWAEHWNTPQSTVVDALGRVATITERNGSDEAVVRVKHDAADNVVAIVDALGRTAYQGVYDLVGRPWRESSLDAATKTSILDPLDAVVEQRDARGALTLTSFDVFHRLSRRWSRAGERAPVTLDEIVIYGDDQTAPLDAARDGLRGRAWRTYDAAGLVTAAHYDLAGNLVAVGRRYLRSAVLIASLEDVRPNPKWPPSVPGATDEVMLEAASYDVGKKFDTAGRLTARTAPAGIDGSRPVLRFTHGASGELTRIELDQRLIVDQAAHNARGDRILLGLTDGVVTRFARDPATSRLQRLRSDAKPDVVGRLQDLSYEYDLAGNLIRSVDGTDDPKLAGRRFSFDPRYRLITAVGRGCTLRKKDPWSEHECTDQDCTPINFRDRYTYDEVGNITAIGRDLIGYPDQREMREGEFASGSNRISRIQVRAESGSDRIIVYDYDAAGNVTNEGGGRWFEWDAANRLTCARVGSKKLPLARYWYDSAGTRVCKLVRLSDERLCLTLFVDGVFERAAQISPSVESVVIEDVIQITDGPWGIARLHRAPGTPDQLVRVLPDRLGSVNVTLDDAGDLLSRSEYTPYGELSARYSFSAQRGALNWKQNGFLGKTRDAETGLIYMGARYLAPWLARFTSAEAFEDVRRQSRRVLDRLSTRTDPPNFGHPRWATNAYDYAAGSPLTNFDLDGKDPQNADTKQPPPPPLPRDPDEEAGGGGSDPPSPSSDQNDKIAIWRKEEELRNERVQQAEREIKEKVLKDPREMLKPLEPTDLKEIKAWVDPFKKAAESADRAPQEARDRVSSERQAMRDKANFEKLTQTLNSHGVYWIWQSAPQK